MKYIVEPSMNIEMGYCYKNPDEGEDGGTIGCKRVCECQCSRVCAVDCFTMGGGTGSDGNEKL